MDESHRNVVKMHQADFIANDGVRIHYYDTQTDKQPVLALPGIGGSACLWEKSVQLFSSKYRVIIMDPRNQGRSERTYRGQRISRHAADLDQLLQKLDLYNVIGMGNSMGAANLWSYLSLYGSQRFCALVDLDQPPKMVNDQSWQFGFKDLTWANFPDYLKVDFGSGIYAHIEDGMFAGAKKEASKIPYFPEKNYLCRIDHAAQDWRDLLLDLKLPMLVLAGKNSPYFDYHFAFAMAKLNPLIKAKIVPQCGHLVQAEQPVFMHDQVEKFLANLPASSKR